MKNKEYIDSSPLGKRIEATTEYDPGLLYRIPRQQARADLDLDTAALPFSGVDIWNLYELSWLDSAGKPRVGVGRLQVPCESQWLVESKSLKLYLNTLNQTMFDSSEAFAACVERDLGECLATQLSLTVWPVPTSPQGVSVMPGVSLDDLPIRSLPMAPDKNLLVCQSEDVVDEQLTSDLFRSCCPVTGQPDWASVAIHYRGPAIAQSGLLEYLLSYRQHSGFHEQCVERIFVEIQQRCQPQSLSVYACFLRRGGIDICPYRSTEAGVPDILRTVRQ